LLYLKIIHLGQKRWALITDWDMMLKSKSTFLFAGRAATRLVQDSNKHYYLSARKVDLAKQKGCAAELFSDDMMSNVWSKLINQSGLYFKAISFLSTD
jgi:hypothetical protein